MKVKTFTAAFYWVFPAVVLAVSFGLVLAAVQIESPGEFQNGFGRASVTKSDVPVDVSEGVRAGLPVAIWEPYHNPKWKSYRNSRFGYEIDYPASWSVKDRLIGYEHPEDNLVVYEVFYEVAWDFAVYVEVSPNPFSERFERLKERYTEDNQDPQIWRVNIDGIPALLLSSTHGIGLIFSYAEHTFNVAGARQNSETERVMRSFRFTEKVR